VQVEESEHFWQKSGLTGVVAVQEVHILEGPDGAVVAESQDGDEGEAAAEAVTGV